MCKSKIFNDVLNAVAEETGISREEMCGHSKCPDVVEARCLLFHYLSKVGFYPSQIARMTGQSRQCVTALLNSFDDRLDYKGKMLSIFSHNIGKKVAGISLNWQEA
jgi:hypothetical protein